MVVKMPPCFAVVLLCLGAVLQAHGAVWLYGERVDPKELKGAAHYNYAYIGRDWPTKVATCDGNQQSPIALDLHVAHDLVPEGQQTTFSYGNLKANGSDLILANNGHTVALTLADAEGWEHNVTIAVRGDPATLVSKFNTTDTSVVHVAAKPIGLHVHTPSEHVIDGRQFPLELHIVHMVDNATLPGCGNASCLAVLGLLFEYGEEANPFIETIFSNMPTVEKTTHALPAGSVLNFSDVLPSDTTHITYPGSLTTPPCTQGVLWHVMQTPLTISRGQVAAIQVAMGDTECPDPKAPTDLRRRRLLDDPAAAVAKPAAAAAASKAGVTPKPLALPYGSTERDWRAPGALPDGCKKLANGHNARDVQPLNGRPIWLYTASKVCPGELNELAAEALDVENPYKLSVSSYVSMKELGFTVPQGSACPSNASATTAPAAAAAAAGTARAVSAASVVGPAWGALVTALLLAMAGFLVL